MLARGTLRSSSASRARARNCGIMLSAMRDAEYTLIAVSWLVVPAWLSLPAL
jgi:hypothetical protein